MMHSKEMGIIYDKYFKMKILIILFALFAYSQADEVKKIKSYAKKCIDETEITPEEVDKLRHADYSVRNEKSQCFIKCVYQKLEFFNEDGEFQPEKMIERIVKKFGADEDQSTQLVHKCKDEKSEDLCEYAFNIYECFWTNLGSSPAKELEKIKAERNST